MWVRSRNSEPSGQQNVILESYVGLLLGCGLTGSTLSISVEKAQERLFYIWISIYEFH